MVEKLLSPLLFPVGFLAATYVWLKIQSADHKAGSAKMRFWIVCASVMACGKYALAWHTEIGSAWRSHPGLTLLSTCIVCMVVFLATRSVHKDFTMTFSPTQPSQHGEKRLL